MIALRPERILIKRPFISLTRNIAILISVASIVSILFKMQEVTAIQYSYEFVIIAIAAPFSTISNGFKFSISTLIGIFLFAAAAIEINFDFYSESTLKIIILWLVYIFGYVISDISIDNNKIV